MSGSGFRSLWSYLAGSIPVLIFILVVILTPLNSHAEEKADLISALKKKVEALIKKVASLEEGHARLYHSLEGKKAAGLGTRIGEKLAIGALVEVEASTDSNEKDGDTSDLVLATFQLGFDADVNEHVTGHVQLLYEEDNTPLEVDEGTITITTPSGFNLVVGKMYLPFGVFNSHFISNPQVLELAETNESAVKVRYLWDLAEVSIGVFNGAVDETGKDNTIADFFASLAVTPTDGVTLGASYITDIGDSNGIEGLLGSPAPTLAKIVSGYGGFISLNISAITIDAEYITASGRFDVNDLDADFDGTGDRPRAYNIEVGSPISSNIEVALKLEGNRDFFSFPKRQYGAALSYGLYDNVTIAVEILKGEFSDNTERTLITTQFGVEF